MKTKIMIAFLVITLAACAPAQTNTTDIQNTAVAIVQTGVALTQTALPTAANTEEDNAMKPKQPPACAFPLAQTTTEESTPEEYTFSEPQVVLTASEDKSTISIIEWLPDNQRALITQDFRSSSDQNIELFNPQTGERQVYATRHQTNHRPKWLPNLNAEFIQMNE